MEKKISIVNFMRTERKILKVYILPNFESNLVQILGINFEIVRKTRKEIIFKPNNI